MRQEVAAAAKIQRRVRARNWGRPENIPKTCLEKRDSRKPISRTTRPNFTIHSKGPI